MLLRKLNTVVYIEKCNKILCQQFLILLFNEQVMESSCLKDFTVKEKLGEGSFACVYKVERNDDHKLYAMKKVKITQMKEQERNNALNEVRVLASLTHPNIVNYKEAFFDQQTQSLCIVMELASAGDLQKKINEHIKNHSYFTEGEIWQVLIQLSRGLKALHDINILHRDLKCANIFCTEDGKFKLGDLNVSKVAKSGLARTQTGTPYYTSPEVWLNKTYNSKCDVWSLGCVIYEMAALRPPFRANNLKELCSRIQRGIYERIPAHYSDDLFSIINTCLKVNPSSRLSACQILENSKVIKHTPNTEKYAFDNDKTKKYNLLGTILCPRNFKVLKNALPAANYEDDPKPKSGRRKAERANSARSLGQPDIPRVITTPKVDDGKSKEVKYAFMHQRKELFPAPRKQPNSELPRQRQLSRQERPVSRNHPQNRLSRNNSVDSLRKRVISQGSNRSIEMGKKELEHSREKEKKKPFMEDISNRCKQIQEKVNKLIGKREQKIRQQKVSDSYEKRYNMPKISSKQKYDPFSKNKISRNNSIEFHSNVPKPQSNKFNAPTYKPNRNGSFQRADSKKKHAYNYGFLRK